MSPRPLRLRAHDERGPGTLPRLVFELDPDGRIHRLRQHLRLACQHLVALAVGVKVARHPGFLWRAVRGSREVMSCRSAAMRAARGRALAVTDQVVLWSRSATIDGEGLSSRPPLPAHASCPRKHETSPTLPHRAIRVQTCLAACRTQRGRRSSLVQGESGSSRISGSPVSNTSP
jgi:hypothetical protein